MKKVNTIRKDIRVPAILVEQVAQYQAENGITTWTGAFLELARKGLESSKKE